MSAMIKHVIFIFAFTDNFKNTVLMRTKQYLWSVHRWKVVACFDLFGRSHKVFVLPKKQQHLNEGHCWAKQHLGLNDKSILLKRNWGGRRNEIPTTVRMLNDYCTILTHWQRPGFTWSPDCKQCTAPFPPQPSESKWSIIMWTQPNPKWDLVKTSLIFSENVTTENDSRKWKQGRDDKETGFKSWPGQEVELRVKQFICCTAVQINQLIN